EKESDILDVWFDSGVSYFCVLKNDEDMKAIGFPADLYLEGSDQHRGWFHSSLLIAIGSQDGTPYKSVLTHGFVVDSSGRKMSKSLGNVIAPDEIINKYGADILRLWAASEDYKNDMRISNEILSRLSEGYRKIRNTIRFMLGNLFDFDETADAVKFEDLNDIDKYEIHNISLLAQNLSRHYSSYDFHLVYQNIYKFVTSFSSFYLDISKDSLYVEAKNSFKRRSIQTVLHYGLNILIKYAGPILPFTSKEAWSYFNKKNKEKELAFEYFDEIDENFIDFELAERFEKLTEIRDIVLSSLEKARTEKVIGSSLEALVIIRAAEEDYKLLSEFKMSELKEIFIVSALQIEKLDTKEGNSEIISEAIVKLAPGQKCARCWTFSESVGTYNDYNDICGRCRDVLIDLK
ncbi:MAG: class I tRNA ligase family protein, partial [bacterium]